MKKVFYIKNYLNYITTHMKTNSANVNREYFAFAGFQYNDGIFGFIDTNSATLNRTNHCNNVILMFFITFKQGSDFVVYSESKHHLMLRKRRFLQVLILVAVFELQLLLPATANVSNVTKR